MLSNVYISTKINVYGQVFGIARFSNAQDLDKLKKALNNIYFGESRVNVKLDQFDSVGRIY